MVDWREVMVHTSGVLRVFLIASNVREVVAELERDQEIERKVYEENGVEVECALCYGDQVILLSSSHGVIMQCMDGATRQELPQGINPNRISAIALTGAMLPPTIEPATYRYWDKLTYGGAVRLLTTGREEPDPLKVVTIRWNFLTKSEQICRIFELKEAIESRSIAPVAIDGRDYAIGAIIQILRSDGELVEHVLAGHGSPDGDSILR